MDRASPWVELTADRDLLALRTHYSHATFGINQPVFPDPWHHSGAPLALTTRPILVSKQRARPMLAAKAGKNGP